MSWIQRVRPPTPIRILETRVIEIAKTEKKCVINKNRKKKKPQCEKNHWNQFEEYGVQVPILS